jgi:hypothetical protein
MSTHETCAVQKRAHFIELQLLLNSLASNILVKDKVLAESRFS